MQDMVGLKDLDAGAVLWNRPVPIP